MHENDENGGEARDRYLCQIKGEEKHGAERKI
jgi:hypothetical protein